ncbi:hypothetical protein DSM104443_02330 [Usitatibacter rugosus]|uniref:Histidine kinase domain-containing protein n=1 Tax=Usitatibacter rugosus TaxID=2732067 RepID=A0A6M4H0C3_9PROT|nr:sensor histidine kinase [Usitatibacter rugosus]QJR11257.1 hypothetical protein DSM104443_02330 [Usitatibacter rugosus]
MIRLLLLAVMLLPLASVGADIPRSLSQYTHQRWTDENGIPGPTFNLVQGKDGYLWVGAGEGALYRFDGVRFEKIELEGVTGRQGSIEGLVAAANGDVWTWFVLSQTFAVYRSGALRAIEAPKVSDVTELAETRDGAIWARRTGKGTGLLRYAKGEWRKFGPADGLPDDYSRSMLVAADGALWVSYFHSVSRLAPGADRFEKAFDTQGENGRISQDPSGRIWISGKRGSYPLTGPGAQGAAPPVRFPYPTANPPVPGRPMFDRDGHLWLALPFGGGLQRVTAPDPAGGNSAEEAASRVETFGVRDGLTAAVTTQLLEDREGNIWVVTEKGLDKFRAATVRVEPMLTKPTPFGDALMASSDGSVYIGESDAVYRVAPGGQPQVILKSTSTPSAICEGPDGAAWIMSSEPIVVWKGDRIVGRVPKAPAEAVIQDCAFDRHGDLWVTAKASGMFRYRDKRWEPMFGPVDRENYFPSGMTRDSRQRLVLQWGPKTLSWIDHPERTSAKLGDAPENLITVYGSPRGHVLSGSSRAFRQFRDGRVETITEAQGLHYRGVKGIAETSGGDTWTVNENFIARTRTADLDRAFAEPAFQPAVVKLSYDDGLPGRIYARAARAMVRGGDGRLWISTLLGTVWMDPERIIRNALMPPVVITSLIVDGKLHRDPGSLTLPAAPSNVEINYAGLSYANPKRVEFRYRLEGYDKDWVDPGTRRQAFYTNLAPGTYRFRVKAANNEGVWNETGAALDFEIPPTFVQSRTFLALCIALGVLLLWAIYRLRVAQVTARIRSRLEAQTIERERIARELHDTLLQSTQGLILHIQAAATNMAPGEAPRKQLEAALEHANDVVAEGRNRVLDLRIAGGQGDVRTVLQEIADATPFDPRIPVHIKVEGKVRPVHPLVLAEVKQIASEALFNIARHARAKSVKVTLTFALRELRIRIHDDGIGIAEELLAAGSKPGHFGLPGMRERAQNIGGTLAVESRPGAGTDVTLILPASD